MMMRMRPYGTVPRGHPLFWANFGVALCIKVHVPPLTGEQMQKDGSAPKQHTALGMCTAASVTIFTVVERRNLVQQ